MPHGDLASHDLWFINGKEHEIEFALCNIYLHRITSENTIFSCKQPLI